ncbi:HAD-IIA family hydrolase [Cohnella kolymensis]|uniref:HAD-IIA family hydrolase n=1 Tax=Cohnella kolymensis TaxID=1590652 RepID=UPI000698106E|nr:HAD-IIA family hydrolase [Cohnella kolymensis]
MNKDLQGTSGLIAPKALLFDLDGTLYRGEAMIPGADRLIAGLQRSGIPYRFVTNNSTKTPEEVALHLRKLGIPADEKSIVTSALGAAYYVLKHHPGAETFVIGEEGLRQALRNAGLRLIEEGEAAGPAALVVQGMDRRLTYDRLAAGVHHILNGAVYVLTNPDRVLPVEGGFLPGAGSIGAALKAATGIEPIVIGKPSHILMDYALEQSGTAPEETWVIGDNPYTDIAAARNAGCPAILVLTGLCDADDWREHCRSADVVPNAVCADLDELVSLIQDRTSNRELRTEGK